VPVAKLASTPDAAQGGPLALAASPSLTRQPLLLVFSVGALLFGLVLAGVVIWLLVWGRKVKDAGNSSA
jgi:hypothetical protein